MGFGNPALRLIRELEGDEPNLVAADQPHTPTIDEQIKSLQTQIVTLNDEISALRRRDETVKFYMHRFDEEMRLAARLQQDFLPKKLPQVGRAHFSTLFRPAGYVSGDLYDVMRIDEAHCGFYMADAVGHGMPAALLTMFIRNALVTKEIIKGGYRLLLPGETIGKLNETLVEQNLSYATFASAIYGTVNTTTGDLSFARGGHPNPILLRADGTTEFPEADGGLLGIFPGDQFASTNVKLNSGDRLFVFSDGVEVAFSADLSADAEQWRKELEQRRHLSSEQILADLSDQIDNAAGSLSPKDDLTIIVVELK
jgi:phosphoserine phosphatase RsbU/P